MVEPKSCRSASSFLTLIVVGNPRRSTPCLATNLKSLIVTSTTCSDCENTGPAVSHQNPHVTASTRTHPHCCTFRFFIPRSFSTYSRVIVSVSVAAVRSTPDSLQSAPPFRPYCRKRSCPRCLSARHNSPSPPDPPSPSEPSSQSLQKALPPIRFVSRSRPGPPP